MDSRDDVASGDRFAAIPWIEAAFHTLPGTRPMAPGDWILRTPDFGRQMAERDRLIKGRPDAVHALASSAMPAAQECLDAVLEALGRDPGYAFGRGSATRPDGAVVKLDRSAPLLTLGRLVQQDFCILESGDDGHVLTGAILCFPASWTLAEKFGRPLDVIHRPVKEYDADLARRVQRLFEGIAPGRPLCRANAIPYRDETLFHPRRESDGPRESETARFLRSERQSLVRLASTGAVVFGIQTAVVPLDAIPLAVRRRLAAPSRAGG